MIERSRRRSRENVQAPAHSTCWSDLCDLSYCSYQKHYRLLVLRRDLVKLGADWTLCTRASLVASRDAGGAASRTISVRE